MTNYEADKYFKEGGKKTEDSGKEHENKKKDHEQVKEIRIKLSHRTIERIIFISLIVLLLGYIIVDNVFYTCTSEASKEPEKTKTTQADAATVTGSVVDNVEETNKETGNETSEEDNETTEEDDEETTSTTSTPEEASASITFTPSDVIRDGAKITKISFTLKNNADMILRARVEASWYDTSDEEIMKDKVTGSKSVLVPASGTKSDSITEFTRKYINPENSKETIVLRAYEVTTEKLLDTTTAAITT